jgi:hypothetical protein
MGQQLTLDGPYGTYQELTLGELTGKENHLVELGATEGTVKLLATPGKEIGTVFEIDANTRDVKVRFLNAPGEQIFVQDGAIAALAGFAGAVGGKVTALTGATGPMIGTKKAPLSNGAAGDFITGLNRRGQTGGVARAVFNPSATPGERTIGAHTLGVSIPDDAIVTKFYYEVNTTFTSATDAATVAFHVEGAGDLLAAIAISDATNMLDAGLHAGKPGFPSFGADAAHDTQPEVAALFAAGFVKTTAERLITATVAVEALTAGKATLFVEWQQGA